MLSHLAKRLAWSIVLFAWLGGLAIAAQDPGAAPAPEAHATIASTASADPIPAAAPESATPLIAQSAGSGSGLDPAIERGSRGVARNLLLAGIAVAGVIAVLSGVFAFRHKKQ